RTGEPEPSGRRDEAVGAVDDEEQRVVDLAGEQLGRPHDPGGQAEVRRGRVRAEPVGEVLGGPGASAGARADRAPVAGQRGPDAALPADLPEVVLVAG